MSLSLILAAVSVAASVTNDDVFVNRPDYVVYVPRQPLEKTLRNPAEKGDTYNDHFQVIHDERRGLLFAFWTQASGEGAADQHIAFSKSADNGRTWTEAEILAGSPSMKHPGLRASWQQPMLTKSGRLYCLWNYEVTLRGPHCGEMYGIFSDDAGDTWSRPGRVTWPRADCDGTDPAKPPVWCNWQRPLRLGPEGKYLVACSHFGKTEYDKMGCRTDFLLFDNIDQNPAVDKIVIKRLAANRNALTLPDSNLEEGSLVKLPDGRLFVLCRTWKGCPYWSQSRDGGETWDEPKPLRNKEGRPFLHCCSPCPIYDWKGCEAGSGTYFALVHDSFDHRQPKGKYQQRGPLYLIAGKFDPKGEQPIAFSEPRLFIPRQHWCNSCYSSYTVVDGKGVLWFPDRKVYLLGKVIGPEWMAGDDVLRPSFAVSDWRFSNGEWGLSDGTLRPPTAVKGRTMAYPERPQAGDIMVRTKVRVQPFDGKGDAEVGVAVVQDDANFWTLRMTYSAKAGRKFVLHETRDGIERAEKADGLLNEWAIESIGWEFGVTYDVSLEVNAHGAIARVIDENGVNVFRKFYRFAGRPGVRSGRPALLAGGGMTLDCSDVRLLSKDPLPQKGPDSLVVWLTYDKRKYAFKNGLAPKGCPLTNAWIECVRDAKLPIPGERVTFRIHGLQDDGKFSAKGTDVAREHPGELPTEVRKIGCWVRDANGGIPVEEYAGKVHAGGGLRYVFPVDCNPGVKWQSAEKMHTTFSARGGGVWESGYVVAPDGEIPDEAYAALLAGRSAALALRHVKPYALFGADERPTVRLAAVSLSGTPRNVRVACTVRDWDGEKALDWSEERELKSGECLTQDIVLDPTEPRGLYFVEATVTDAATGAELALARTNLAQLPPHTFTTTPETSLMGLAAYWPIPDEESVQKLMDRMGVVRVREGDSRKQHAPRVTNRHSQVPNEKKLTTEAEKIAWVERELAACREQGNAYWELGNELNMSTLGIALKGGGIGKALAAPRYAEWVRRVDKVRREKGYGDVKLLSLGVAGFDRAFFNAIYDAGLADMLSGLCLHPGRGNFTPDYPYLRPELAADKVVKTDDPVKAEQLENSNFWNFYGAVRGLKALSKERGEKPLWLTEVYTPTFPNSGWEDTLRDSADNVVLSYALAAAEGVKAAFYYQLFDGVWYDRCGVNPKDREYFFGLLNRDLSPKPAFMAYCAVAEALEGATFEGWAKLPNAKQHGLVFKDGKMGRFAILWDRSEGYVLTKNERPFKSPEPWQKKWTKRTTVKISSEAPLTVIDVLGRRRVLPSRNGSVAVALDGSPQFVLLEDKSDLGTL